MMKHSHECWDSLSKQFLKSSSKPKCCRGTGGCDGTSNEQSEADSHSALCVTITKADGTRRKGMDAIFSPHRVAPNVRSHSSAAQKPKRARADAVVDDSCAAHVVPPKAEKRRRREEKPPAAARAAAAGPRQPRPRALAVRQKVSGATLAGDELPGLPEDGRATSRQRGTKVEVGMRTTVKFAGGAWEVGTIVRVIQASGAPAYTSSS